MLAGNLSNWLLLINLLCLILSTLKYMAYILSFLTFVIFFADVNIFVGQLFFTSASTMSELGVTSNGMGIASLNMYDYLLEKSFPLPEVGLSYVYFLHLSMFLIILGKVFNYSINVIRNWVDRLEITVKSNQIESVEEINALTRKTNLCLSKEVSGVELAPKVASLFAQIETESEFIEVLSNYITDERVASLLWHSLREQDELLWILYKSNKQN